MRAVDESARLADPSVVEFKKDLGDASLLSIQSIFPNVVLQQILNCTRRPAARAARTSGVEVVWTFFATRTTPKR